MEKESQLQALADTVPLYDLGVFLRLVSPCYEAACDRPRTPSWHGHPTRESLRGVHFSSTLQTWGPRAVTRSVPST
jgi:hypothetical protein